MLFRRSRPAASARWVVHLLPPVLGSSGSRIPDRLQEIAGIRGAGFIEPAVNNGGWLITHGTEDELLPVEGTRAQMKLLNERGFRIDYREYRKPQTIDLRRELPEIRDWLLSRLNEK